MTQSNHPCQQPIEMPPGTRRGLVVVVRKAKSRGKGACYLVRCDCGAERLVHGWSLRRWPFTSHQWCK